AALWAAKGMALANATDADTRTVAENVVHAEYDRFKEPVTVNVKVDGTANTVMVEVSQSPVRFFSDLLPIKTKPISVSAEARLVGGGNLCVIGLNENVGGTIGLEADARLTATNCAIYSNSTSGAGLKSKGNARLIAHFTCTAGGYTGAASNFTPEPVTDCPQIEDPLASRAAPTVGACDENNLTISGSGSVTLWPGVYCGGLSIEDQAEARLSPGVYVMKDGALRVDNQASLEGEGVGFFFTGKQSLVHFAADTEINLTAPTDGAMAGLLFFEDHNSQKNRKFEIFSNNARELLGTIYLPNGRLYIDADEPIADQSAFTVIVANKLELYAGPNLVLNTDYGATDVPVPQGVGPIDGDVILSH
ncbi:MAG: hypothetical protein MI723_08105, partial [Caulobacterales bacterium]|nr:hypothetical protein [Caulobacterales bacterium]